LADQPPFDLSSADKLFAAACFNAACDPTDRQDRPDEDARPMGDKLDNEQRSMLSVDLNSVA